MTINIASPTTPLVSILTPTWNRASYLERVWVSLEGQTYKNIEWLVANDGSSDETDIVVRELAKKSSFPVVLIQASVHIGKTRMDNEAVAQAKGEFIFWNDSDDYLLPNAIDLLITAWNSIPNSKREEYVGITALCADQNGTSLTHPPHKGQFDSTWNDLRETYRLTGDKLHFTKASALKNTPFPEVDYYMPESVIWTTLGDRKTRFIPDIVQIKEYRAKNCISFSGKMEYNRGRAHSIAVTERNIRAYPRKLRHRLWVLITYIRCCIHGEISLSDQLQLWSQNSKKYVFFLMWPLSRLLALKDQLQCTVNKTHREFQAAEKIVIISRENLSKTLDSCL